MVTKVLLSALGGVVLSLPAGQAWSQQGRTVESLIEAQRNQLSRVLGHAAPQSRLAGQYGLEQVAHDVWRAGAWVVQSKVDHIYSGLRRAESRDSEWSGTEWVSRVVTTYDENGLIHQVDFHGTPFVQYHYEYAYDIYSGRSVLSMELARTWDGSGWQDLHRTVYDVENHPVDGLRIIGGQVEQFGGEWAPELRFLLAEVEGDLIQEYQLWGGEEWIPSGRTIYDGHTIASLNAHLAALGRKYGDFADLYLGLLLLPSNTIQEWNGAEWANISRQWIEAYHYVSGEPAVLRSAYWENNDWVDELRFEIYYGLDGAVFRPSSSVLQTPGYSGWMPVTRETYDYDGNGQIAEVVQSSGNVGIFVNTDRYHYTWRDLSVGRDEPGVMPIAHVLEPAYPNPFNPTTTVTYRLAAQDNVRLEVRDTLGRLIRVLVDGFMPAGVYRAAFDAEGLPSGVYAVLLRTRSQDETRLVTLIK